MAVLNVQLGNFDTRRLAADTNAPLDSQGQWLGRVVAGWQKGDSLTQGAFSERCHVSPMLTFQPTPGNSLTLGGLPTRAQRRRLFGGSGRSASAASTRAYRQCSDPAGQALDQTCAVLAALDLREVLRRAEMKAARAYSRTGLVGSV